MNVEQPRHIPLAGTYNVRDIGGYPVGDGQVIRDRTLIRADALHRIDDAGRAHFAELGVRTVIDLREDTERDVHPDAFGEPRPTSLPIPVFQNRVDLSTLPLPEIYRRMVDDFGDQLTRAVRELARPGALPAVVHCSAGKDRTGVVIALVLSVAGVSAEVIAEDYALTGMLLTEEYVADIERRLAQYGLPQVLRDNAVDCPPQLIFDTLDRISERHGTVRDFLLAHGATEDELDALRDALVETRPLAEETSTRAEHCAPTERCARLEEH